MVLLDPQLYRVCNVSALTSHFHHLILTPPLSGQTKLIEKEFEHKSIEMWHCFRRFVYTPLPLFASLSFISLVWHY